MWKVLRSFKHSYNFELSNKSDEDSAMVHQKNKGYWAHMRENLRRATRKEVFDPITNEKIKCEGCVDRWWKDEEERNNMFISGHKKEMQSWDAELEAGLGDHAEYRQPRQLREQIRSGKPKRRQSRGCAMPVKQSFEYHRTEDSRRQPQAGRTTSIPINFVVVSMGWLEDEFVVGQVVAVDWK